LFKDVDYLTIKRLINESKIENSLQFEYKYIQAILNSKLIKFYVNELFYDGTHFYPNHMKALPIKPVSKLIQDKFVVIVDYLHFLQLNNLDQIISHTTNERLINHLVEVLNIMVYEIYFEEHMKTECIDVLQYINPKPISGIKNIKEIEKEIQDFYFWYQKPENPVRQRMLLLETRSRDIIALIDKSIQ
jgi:hypothetical protein